MHVLNNDRAQSLLEPELCQLTSNDNASSTKRLSRLQQLTLSTWRLAAAKVARTLDPLAIFDHAALHAVIGALGDVDQPLVLFAHHSTATAELALINSLIGDSRPGLAYDILDAAFLARWNELVSSGSGPAELPPASASSDSRQPLAEHRLVINRNSRSICNLVPIGLLGQAP